MEDNLIIELLFRRDESALGELSRKYSSAYRRVFRSTLSDVRDVEECENDLLMSVWSSVPPNRPCHLCAYVLTLARRIGIDRLKYNTRDKRSSDYTVMLSELSDSLPQASSAQEAVDEDSRRITAVIDAFLSSLDKETRVMFVRRYMCLESASDIAKRYSVSENRVCVRLLRARKKLRKMLMEEGIVI